MWLCKKNPQNLFENNSVDAVVSFDSVFILPLVSYTVHHERQGLVYEPCVLRFERLL